MDNKDDIKRISESVPEVNQIDPTVLNALKDQLKTEIAEELKTEKQKAMMIEKERRAKAERDYQEYVAKMKLSEEPWVDVQGWVETEQGVEIKLEWNDAFVDYLRTEGVTGADDDDVVQKYVTLLLRDMSDRMESRFQGEDESEFGG